MAEKSTVRQKLGALNARASLVTFAAMAVAWQVLSFFFPPYLIPGFQAIIPNFIELIFRPSTYIHAGVSLLRILIAFALSALFGIGVGLLMGLWHRAEAYLLPLVRFIMGVPALSWILIGVIWFRSSEVRVFFVMFVITFPILTLNTLDGIKSAPKELYDMLLSFRPTTTQLLRIVLLPATLPYMLVGAKVALSFATRLVVFVELIGATMGIGARMFASFQTFNLTEIFVWTGILVALLLLLNWGMAYAERRLLRWRPEVIRAT